MSAESFAAWMARRRPPTAAEIRVEVWNLGVRHHGRPLEGAEHELASPGLDVGRANLLRACIRTLSRQARVAASVR